MRAVCLKLVQDTALGTAADCFITPKLEENRTGNEGYCTHTKSKSCSWAFQHLILLLIQWMYTLALSAEIQTLRSNSKELFGI